MTDKFAREEEDKKIRVTLDLTMRDVKSLLGVLGATIRRYKRRLAKKARAGKTFVPEPGRRNIEVLTLHRYEAAEAAVRAHVAEMPREDGRIGQLRPSWFRGLDIAYKHEFMRWAFLRCAKHVTGLRVKATKG